jgi:hypothetical protein
MGILKLGDYDPKNITINSIKAGGFNSLFINPDIIEKE